MVKAIQEHLEAVTLWANACGNTSFKQEDGEFVFADCGLPTPALYAREETTLGQAFLGAGAHTLGALYTLILSTLFALPLLFVGALLLFINWIAEQCCDTGKGLKEFGAGLVSNSFDLVLGLYLETIGIVATFVAYSSGEKL